MRNFTAPERQKTEGGEQWAWLHSQTNIFVPIFLGVMLRLGVIQMHPA
jgi:hypothetical protein